MKRKTFIPILVLAMILLNCILPVLQVNAANVGVVFDNELYVALKSRLGSSATYNDTLKTINIPSAVISEITELNLSNCKIDDLTGLDAFYALRKLDLSSNELTHESNLSVLGSIPTLRYLDLSSNKIEDLNDVAMLSNIQTLNLHNQVITKTEIIEVDTSEENGDNIEEMLFDLPQIFEYTTLKDEWMDDSYSYSGTYSTPPTINWSKFGNNQICIKVGKVNADYTYTLYNGAMLTLTIEVKDSEDILANTKAVINYIVVDEKTTGIIFKDENLYKRVKAQLTKGQTINTDLQDNTSTRNLYEKAYDNALTLVITKNDIINNIPSLLISGIKAKDLTGIEKFIGLESALDVSDNYVEEIDKIVELQENKIAEEAKLEEKIKTQISKLMEYKQKYETLKEEAKRLAEAKIAAINTLASTINSISKFNTEDKDAEKNEFIAYFNRATAAELKAEKEAVTVTSTSVGTKTFAAGEVLTEENVIKIQSDIEEIIKSVNEAEVNSEKQVIAKDYLFTRFTKLVETYNNAYVLAPLVIKEISEIEEEEDIKKITLEEAKRIVTEQLDYIIARVEYLTAAEEDIIADILGVVVADDQETTDDATKASKANAIKVKAEELKEYMEESNVAYLRTLISQFRNTETLLVDALIAKIAEIYSAGSISSFEEDLTKITYRLSLTQNVEELVNLPKLENLDLSENLIDTIKGFESLVDLKELYLDDNELGDVNYFDFTKLEKLLYLDLGFNMISNIDFVNNLPETLMGLRLDANRISDISKLDITKYEDFHYLDLSCNEISDISRLIENIKAFARADGYRDNVSEYLSSGRLSVYVWDQTLKITDVVASDISDTARVQLPPIFSQVEELQPGETSFGYESLTGNATNDGKSVILDTRYPGTYQGYVNVLGDNIAEGTRCYIYYKVVHTEVIEPDQNENVVNNTVENVVDNTIEEVNNTVENTVDNTVDNTIENVVDNTIDNTVVENEIANTVENTIDNTVDNTVENIVENTVDNTVENVVDNTVENTVDNTIGDNTVEDVASNYEITESYIAKVSPKTSKEEFVSELNTVYTVKIESNGEEITNEIVATGMVAKLYDENGEQVDEFTIVVLGDVNGDGLANAADSALLLGYRAEMNDLSGAYYEAADINRDGVCNGVDSTLLLYHRAGINGYIL